MGSENHDDGLPDGAMRPPDEPPVFVFPRDVLESATDGFVAYDAEYRFLYLNAEAERICGRSRNELLGRVHWDEFSSQAGSPFEAHLRRAMSEGVAGVFEEFYPPLGGWFEVRVSPAPWNGIGVWYRDINARKRSEQALRASEQQYRSIVSALEEGVAFVDGDGVVRAFNASAERILGISGGQIIGRNIDNLPRLAIREDGSPSPADEHPALRTLRSGAALFGVAMGIVRPDDSVAWLSLNTQPLFHSDGQLPYAVIVSFSDVTERKRTDAALLQSVERFRRLSESAPVGIFEAGPEGGIEFVNERWCEIAGIPEAEALGQGWVKAVHPDDQARVCAVWQQCVDDPRGYDAEFRFVHPGGETRWVLARTAPVRSATGAVLGHVGATEDITERRRAETETRRSLELLRVLNQARETGSLVRGVTTLLQEWSGCEAVGIRLSEGGDFPYFETRGFSAGFVSHERSLCTEHPEGPDLACLCGAAIQGRFSKTLPQLTQHGSFWTNRLAHTVETQAEGLPGNIRGRCVREGYQSFALVPLRFSGRTLGLIQLNDRRSGRLTADFVGFLERSAAGIAAVIEQQTTESALRESEERYRLISENTADVIWLADVATGQFTWCSPSVERLLGYTPKEFLRLTWPEVLTPGSLDAATESLARHLAALASGDESARGKTIEVVAARKDASAVPLEVAVTLIGGGGRVTGMVGVARDISERKLAEQNRALLEDQLRQAQKLESIGRLAGGIAHDFNNLLTVINGYGDMMLAELNADHPLHDSISDIRAAGERAADLTRGLLAFSRKQAIEQKPIPLNALLTGSQPLLQRLVGEDIHLQLSLDPALGNVMADPGQLHQVLLNLVANGRDAMPGGGTITIATATANLPLATGTPGPDLPAGAYALLTVTDTGPGIDEAVRHRIFDPFFTTKGSGTGLGLSTVYGILRQSGGAIELDSRDAPGASFRVWLPCTSAPAESSTPRQIDQDGLRGNETVLVVEDQDDVRRFTVGVLRSYGYRVLEAAGGEQALVLVRSHPGPIHLVLTDVVMPGITGVALAARLQPLCPDTRVMFMSGYAEEAVARLVENDQEAEFLDKPFTPEKLARRVRALLGVPRSRSKILVIDDDPGIRRLFTRVLSDAGYDVEQAADGSRAFQLIEKNDFDLILTDLVMPEREGIETIRDIRKRIPGQKIIAISGAFGGAFLRPAKALGANAALAKPVNPKVLLETVTKVLASNAT